MFMINVHYVLICRRLVSEHMGHHYHI